jgi:hypothetical protein
MKAPCEPQGAFLGERTPSSDLNHTRTMKGCKLNFFQFENGTSYDVNE